MFSNKYNKKLYYYVWPYALAHKHIDIIWRKPAHALLLQLSLFQLSSGDSIKSVLYIFEA
jgi:hypothetical protein